MPPAELRCVIDTNVLVSAALFADSIPGQALRHVLRHGSLLASPQTLTELAEVLGRPKLDRYLTWPEREQFLAALADQVELVEPCLDLAVCRDPDGDAMLELAVAGQATAVVAGDPDLLALHPFKDIPILNPRAFCEQFVGRS